MKKRNMKDINNNNHEKRRFLSLENNTLVGTMYFDSTNIDKNFDFITIGNTTTKTGCMKWYVYDKSDTEYGLLLDHNITWGTTYQETINAKDMLTSTEEGGSGWKVTPNLISGEDIAHITKKQGWDKTNSETNYCVDTLTKIGDSNKGLGTSKYYWLFDYTEVCTSSGCRVDDRTGNNEHHHYGYWLSNYSDEASSYVWNISYIGILYTDKANLATRGLRPVIIINK